MGSSLTSSLAAGPKGRLAQRGAMLKGADEMCPFHSLPDHLPHSQALFSSWCLLLSLAGPWGPLGSWPSWQIQPDKHSSGYIWTTFLRAWDHKSDSTCWGACFGPSPVSFSFVKLIHVDIWQRPIKYCKAIHFSSVAQLCPTLYNPTNCNTPGLPVHHQLPQFTQTHVH